jgi:hypothetical protein
MLPGLMGNMMMMMTCHLVPGSLYAFEPSVLAAQINSHQWPEYIADILAAGTITAVSEECSNTQPALVQYSTGVHKLCTISVQACSCNIAD